MKSGSFNLLEPSGPVHACNRTALPCALPKYFIFPSVSKMQAIHMDAPWGQKLDCKGIWQQRKQQAGGISDCSLGFVGCAAGRRVEGCVGLVGCLVSWLGGWVGGWLVGWVVGSAGYWQPTEYTCWCLAGFYSKRWTVCNVKVRNVRTCG